MVNLFGADDDTSATDDIFYLTKYLDLPITDTDLKSFILYQKLDKANPSYPFSLRPTPIRRPIIDYLRASKADLHDLSPIDPSEYPSMWGNVPLDLTTVDTILSFSSAVVYPVLRSIKPCLKDKFECDIADPTISVTDPELRDLLARLLYWNSLLDKYDQYRSSGGRGHLVWSDLGITYMFSTRLCACSGLAGLTTHRVYTYEQFLGWKDAAYVRMNIRLACLNVYPARPDIYRRIRDSIKWQEMNLRRYGNPGYELAKSTEALAKTYINRLSGGVQLGVHDAFSLATAKHIKKEKKLRQSMGIDSDMTYGADMYERDVLSLCEDVQTIVEVFGCQKAISHPLIDVHRSGLSAADEARSPDYTQLHDAMELRATWCRIFTEGYIRKKQEWPILLNTTPGTCLHDLYIRGILAYHRTSTPLSDWFGVSFGHMFDFDYYPNFLDVADDKSIAVKVSEKASAWDRDCKVESERRLLLEILRRPEIDHRKIFKMIEDDAIDPELLCVVVTPKEREFKLQARMFAMLNLDIRNAATIGEANLAHTILPYVQQLTMADDKLTVHQRFLDMTRPLASSDTIRLFIELDLSRWNLRWRALCIDMIGRDMNDLFGMLRAYTWIHKFFADCMVYVRSGTNRPDGIELPFPPESELLWYKHVGGFEGLAQKLWSIATVAMIARAVDNLPLSYTMTAQGDNVVLAITTDRDYTLSEAEQVRLLRDDVLLRCSIFSASVNQDLKPEECVDSTTTVTYSKAVYVNGVDYPTTIKSLSRLFPTASVDFPSPESFLRSIFAGSLAAAEQARSGIACYATGLWSAALSSCLMNRSCGPYTSDVRLAKLGTDIERTRWFLTIPAELGGYTVNGFYQYLYRGSGDPVSKSLASWFLLQQYYPPAASMMLRLVEDDTYVAHPQLESLIKDPYSLPIKRPTTPEDAVAADTLAVIKTFVKNKAIRDALSCSTPQYKQALLDALKRVTPFNPVIVHDLYDSSVLGTQEMISKMFITTRSIQVLSRKSGGTSITQTLTRAAREGLHTHVAMQMTLKHAQPQPYTLYSMVYAARQRWSTTGVALENITAYLPCDFHTSVGGIGYDEEIVLHARLPATVARYTRGTERAYLGTRTREKRADHGYKIVGRSYASSAATTLQKILSWSNNEEPVQQLIDHLTMTRIGIPISRYSKVLPTVIGGSAAHRFASRLGGTSAHIMGQSTFASHCVFDSDYAGFLSATKDDYPLMFQEFFLFMLALADYHVAENGSETYCEVHLQVGHRPLRTISGDRFTCLPGPLPTLDYERLPTLIQDKSVEILRVSGLVPTSRPTPVMMPASSLKFQALCSLISTALGSHTATMGVLDHVAPRITLPIGILELAGMGVSTYLQACAVCALDLINSALNSRRSEERRNAGVSYLVMRYARVSIAPILPLLRHPMMMLDDTVIKLGLGDTPRYMGASLIERILISDVGFRIKILSTLPRSIYHTLPVACFASDTLSRYGHKVLSAVRRIASYVVASNLATPDEGRYFVGSSILVYRRHRHEGEDAMLTALYNHLLWYSVKPPRYTYINRAISTYAEDLATSRGRCAIRQCALSDEEVVRLYREDVNPHPVRVQRIQFTEVDFLPLSYTYDYSTNIAYISDVLTHKWMMHLERNTRILAPFGSSAYLAWQHVGALLRAPLVLVIGAGLGGAAAIACLAGADYVYGLDLRSDLPLVARPDSYTPPLVRVSGFSHIYNQVVESFRTTGDWFDETISSSVLRRFAGNSVIVVDLSTDRGSSPDVLVPLERYSRARLHLIRCVAPMIVQSRFTAYCRERFELLGVHQFESVSGLIERIYILGHPRTTILRRGMYATITSGLHIHSYTDTTPVLRLRPGVSPVYLTLCLNVAMVTAYLGGSTGRTVRESLVAALEMFSDILRTATSRPSYEEWTSTLSDAAQCDWLLNTPRNSYAQKLSTAIRTGVYTLSQFNTVHVLMTPTLIHSFVTQACRLIGHLDRLLPTNL